MNTKWAGVEEAGGVVNGEKVQKTEDININPVQPWTRDREPQWHKVE
jgi:hypothetical protein